jgi:hypothetical protein
MRRRKPVQHFEAPPEKISGDQDAERYLYQLDDQFVFAHRNPPALVALSDLTYNESLP